MHGIVAFLVGAVLALIGFIIVICQVAASRRRPEFAASVAIALSGSGSLIAIGCFFVLAAEFQWLPGRDLDAWIFPAAGIGLLAVIASHIAWRWRRAGPAPAQPLPH